MSETAFRANPLPQPEDISSKERDDAMGAYFMTFATLGIGLPLPFLSLLASVIYHFVNAKNSKFVAFHSLQSLLSEIPISLINGIAVIWGAILLFSGTWTDMIVDESFESFTPGQDPGFFWPFLIFTVALTLIYIVYSLVAAFRAKKGRFFYFPLLGVFVYWWYFLRESKRSGREEENKNLPPKGF